MFGRSRENSGTWLPIIPAHIGLAVFDILIPLYAVEVLKQDLLFVGILIAVEEAVSIPASTIFAYFCDKSGRYRVFITLPLFLIGVTVFTLPYATDPYTLLFVASLVSLLFSIYRPTINLLIAESNPFNTWIQALSSFMFIRGTASFIGLLLGTLLSPHLSYGWMFTTIGVLNILSSTLSLFLIQEPQIKIERRIAFVERQLNKVNHSLQLLRLSDLRPYHSYIMKETSRLEDTGFKKFLLAVSLFTLASNLTFATLPVLLQQEFQEKSGVFSALLFNSLLSTAAYFFLGRNVKSSVMSARASSLIRGIMVAALIPSFYLPSSSSILLISVILGMTGLMWALFELSTNYLSVKIGPAGGAGIYFSLSRLGGLLGAILGGYIASTYGVPLLFITGSLLFISAFIVFVTICEPDA